MPELLTTRQLADFLRLSIRTVNDFRYDGAFPFLKRNGRVLYRRADILTLLDRNLVIA